ncbi:serine/arginine repetitive matrix protein 1-like [Cydia amplana]|uniref:serine/arginine repetitive matrix protein 1-like n=1 Tax=Cydia amplana TaxID=1869771 RepID=UPI002FE55F1E
MMVETILDSSQDFGMSNGVLPQWKRELLQRRAARARPAPPSAPAPPPAPPPEEDEELRYGPGIVKRLKSRYLSLALRDAPRRRPSVLRRAASLEHLLDERPPPAPRPQRQRPVSLAPACPAAIPPRRDSVKRARSVDALSRLEREEPPPSPPPPPPIAPRPPAVRNARPPRRPAPLLRETERPPPDVVKSTLRKFESAPTRRTAPAARVSAVLRGFTISTSEPNDRSPSPITDVSIIEDPESPQETKTVSRAALDGIAQAGSTVRYSFEAPKRGSHLPLVSASNPVLLGRARLSPSPRRVGVIRPMPAPTLERSVSTPAPLPEDIDKIEVPRIVTPPPSPIVEPETPKEKKETPSALIEPIPRSPPEEIKEVISFTPPRVITPEPKIEEIEIKTPELKTPELNGHVERKTLKTWKSLDVEKKEPKENGDVKSWIRGGSPAAARRGRVPPPAATSVVFNFSGRKEVPDYIENDGIILRNKRDKIKASDPGVVVLRPEALTRDSDSDETDDCGPPSPLAVRFINDNVLINGRSSMPGKVDRCRAARLKIQFDDSLTRTFEYPSETSLCEDSPPPPQPAHQAALASNTHIASASLSRYTPHKTLSDAFQLGVTRHEREEEHTVNAERTEPTDSEDARPCAADCARTWSESRTHATDLLFCEYTIVDPVSM